MTTKLLNSLPQNLLITGDFKTGEILIDGKQLNGTLAAQLVGDRPDRFNWGYPGGGPQRLALAILLEYMPRGVALHYHQDFKWSHVATWPRENIAFRLDLRAAMQKIIEPNVTQTSKNYSA